MSQYITFIGFDKFLCIGITIFEFVNLLFNSYCYTFSVSCSSVDLDLRVRCLAFSPSFAFLFRLYYNMVLIVGRFVGVNVLITFDVRYKTFFRKYTPFINTNKIKNSDRPINVALQQSDEQRVFACL